MASERVHARTIPRIASEYQFYEVLKYFLAPLSRVSVGVGPVIALADC